MSKYKTIWLPGQPDEQRARKGCRAILEAYNHIKMLEQEGGLSNESGQIFSSNAVGAAGPDEQNVRSLS